MSRTRWLVPSIAVAAIAALATWQLMSAQQPGQKADQPLLPPLAEPKAPDFATLMARMKAAKPEIAKKHNEMLAARYDLADRAADGAKMTRGKPIQAGPRAKLPAGGTWAQLGTMS